MLPRGPRGITLTELVIVMALAAMVMMGLVTFYLNSQNLWFDGSSQAMVQRDGTLLLESLAQEVRKSTSVQATFGFDPNHKEIFLTGPQGHSHFYCDSTDYRIYFASDSVAARPVVDSRIQEFLVDSDSNFVHVISIKLGTEKTV